MRTSVADRHCFAVLVQDPYVCQVTFRTGAPIRDSRAVASRSAHREGGPLDCADAIALATAAASVHVDDCFLQASREIGEGDELSTGLAARLPLDRVGGQGTLADADSYGDAEQVGVF